MCRIESAPMSAAEDWITDRRRGWEARLDRLGDILAEGDVLTEADILNETATTEEKP